MGNVKKIGGFTVDVTPAGPESRGSVVVSDEGLWSVSYDAGVLMAGFIAELVRREDEEALHALLVSVYSACMSVDARIHGAIINACREVVENPSEEGGDDDGYVEASAALAE